MNLDCIKDPLARKFFEEHVTKLPTIPTQPYKREEILDPSQPIPLKRRIKMFIQQKELEEMKEYESRPDVVTFNKFYPQPGRTQMLLQHIDDPACKHLPYCDRIKFAFDKMNQAYVLAHPEQFAASDRASKELHVQLFGTDEDLMGEMIKIYHEDPKQILPFIKGELKGEDYWEQIYKLHVSMCARKGIPHLEIPEEMPEQESAILFKKAQKLIDDLGELREAAVAASGGGVDDDETDWEENDRIIEEALPDYSDDWDKHFNVARDPFTGGLVNFYEGIKIVCNPYKSDYNTDSATNSMKRKKTEEPEYDWKAMREKMEKDFKEWEEMRAEKKKKEVEKKEREAAEKKKREEDEEYEKAVEAARKIVASRRDPKTGKRIGFSCFHDM
uniref:Uncharacterized protein n=1 Tax=Panagrolaimus sp. ES5 TaxID=591445 RepID=A0AC34GVG4_9BILA